MKLFKRESWSEGTILRFIAEVVIVSAMGFTLLPPIVKLIHWWFTVWLGN